MVAPIVRAPPAPAPQQAQRAAPAAAAGGDPAEYKVKPGDSLSKIAAGLKGDARYKSLSVPQLVDLLREKNPQVTTPQPNGPRREQDGHWIYPDEMLKLPDPPAPPPAPTPVPVPDTAPPAPGNSGQVPGNTPPAPGNAAWAPPGGRPAPGVPAGAAAPPSPLKAQIEANFGVYKAALEKPVDENYLARLSQVEGELEKMAEAAKGLPKDQDPTRTSKYQTLLTMLDTHLEQIEKAEGDATSVVKSLVEADKKPGGITKPEAQAAFEALTRLDPMIRDPETMFAPSVSLLKKAGVIAERPPAAEEQPQPAPAQRPAAAAGAAPGVPPARAQGQAPAGIPPQLIAQLQAQIKGGGYSQAIGDQVNFAARLAATNKPENVATARDLIVGVISSPEYQAQNPKK